MKDFLEIKSLSDGEQKALVKKLLERIEEKKKAGTLTDREIREIEEMRLRANADILDVQSVFQTLKFDSD